MTRTTGLTLMFALLLTALRYNGPARSQGPATAAGPAGVNTRLQAPAGLPPLSPPAITATTTEGIPGTCTAYLPPGPDPIRDANRGRALAVVNDFLAHTGNSSSASVDAVIPALTYVIALVPDPRHTHLSLYFDRTMESIEQAAQDEGFTYNSSWLPWPTDNSQFQSRVDQIEEDEAIRQRESCPGILLFRRNVGTDPPSLITSEPFASGLVVLLVGEQPTGGLNRHQWLSAVDWVRRHGDPAAPLRILGPTFSGSFASLARNLEQLRPFSFAEMNGASIYVFSGPVGSRPAIKWFQKRIEKLPYIRFGAFQENDDLQIDRFLHYLNSENIQSSEVAILSEDETAYGFIEKRQSESSQSSPNFQPVRLYYPRDISALRNAYHDQGIFAVRDRSTETQPNARLVLQPNETEDTVTDGDSISAYSKQQTALDEEASLYGIVGYLDAHHSRYILLRCTNPLDFLFLARFLQHAYANGRIVTVGSELLFGREVDTTEFRGVLALTNFPLLPNEPHWTQVSGEGAGDSHRVFSSHPAEETYLAGRYLIDGDHKLFAIHTKPTDTDQMTVDPYGLLTFTRSTKSVTDFADPFWLHGLGDNSNEFRAASWLSVLGRDGYWPVAVLNDASVASLRPRGEKPDTVAPNRTEVSIQPNQPSYSKSSLQYYRELPHSWKFCGLAAILLLIFHIFACRVAREHSAIGIVTAFRPIKSPEHSVLLGIGSGNVFCICFLVLLPFLLCLPSTPGFLLKAEGVPILWLVAFSLLGLLVSLVYAQWRRARWTFIAFLAVLAIFFVGAAYISLFDINKANAGAAFYRSLHLTSGVSPLLPALFLAMGFYSWSVMSLAGSALLSEDRPRLPHLSSEKDRTQHWYELPPGLYRVSHKMANAIERVARPLRFPKRVFVPLIGSLLFFWIGFWPRLPVAGFEGRAYINWFSLAIVCALALMVAEAARMFWTWNELARLLRSLSRLKLRRTFAALNAISFKSLWSMSGNVQLLQYRFFSHGLEAAHRLNNLTKSRGNSIWSIDDVAVSGSLFVKERAKYLDRGVIWVLNRDKKPQIFIRQLFCRAVADVFNRVLLPAWREETDSLNVSSRDEATASGTTRMSMTLSDDQVVCAAEEFVSYHYIAYIQNILARLRTIVVSVVMLFVATTFAIACYPFIPKSGLFLCMLVELFLIAIVVCYVYAGMARDETLSYITNTEPGRLGAEFWLKFITFIVGPVIGLMATQFPQVADSIYSWLQPGLEAIK